MQDVEAAMLAVPREMQPEATRDTRVAVVYMNVDASDTEITEAREVLEAAPFVARVRFLDQEEALVEFRRMFRDDPEIRDQVEADQLPPSFRVVLASPRDEAALLRAVGRLRGVDEVVGDQVAGDDERVRGT